MRRLGKLSNLILYIVQREPGIEPQKIGALIYVMEVLAIRAWKPMLAQPFICRPWGVEPKHFRRTYRRLVKRGDLVEVSPKVAARIRKMQAQHA